MTSCLLVLLIRDCKTICFGMSPSQIGQDDMTDPRFRQHFTPKYYFRSGLFISIMLHKYRHQDHKGRKDRQYRFSLTSFFQDNCVESEPNESVAVLRSVCGSEIIRKSQMFQLILCNGYLEGLSEEKPIFVSAEREAFMDVKPYSRPSIFTDAQHPSKT